MTEIAWTDRNGRRQELEAMLCREGLRRAYELVVFSGKLPLMEAEIDC